MKVTTGPETVQDRTITTTRETLSSVSLDKNSKGYTWGIKLYFDEHDEQDIENTFRRLKDLDTKLTVLYGPKGGEVN